MKVTVPLLLKITAYLKKLVAIVAIAGILIQTFSMVVIVAEYYANKDFIAKNLCENRDKPMLHCDGKCCLKKKLANNGNEQAPSQRTRKNNPVINLFYTNNKYEVKRLFSVRIPKNYFRYNERLALSLSRSIFHPPCA